MEPVSVMRGASLVDDDNRLLADNPGVVTLRQGSDVTGPGVEFGAVGHNDGQGPGLATGWLQLWQAGGKEPRRLCGRLRRTTEGGHDVRRPQRWAR